MKKLTRKELESQVEALSNCPIWECYTRAALTLRWNDLTQNADSIVYCDVDSMHELNKLYTHAGVDKKLRDVLKSIRKIDSVIISRWLNGDELIFILKSGNPVQFINRLQALLLQEGINATFSYTFDISGDSFESINPLDIKVQNAKNKNMRGRIIE